MGQELDLTCGVTNTGPNCQLQPPHAQARAYINLVGWMLAAAYVPEPGASDPRRPQGPTAVFTKEMVATMRELGMVKVCESSDFEKWAQTRGWPWCG